MPAELFVVPVGKASGSFEEPAGGSYEARVRSAFLQAGKVRGGDKSTPSKCLGERPRRLRCRPAAASDDGCAERAHPHDRLDELIERHRSHHAISEHGIGLTAVRIAA